MRMQQKRSCNNNEKRSTKTHAAVGLSALFSQRGHG